MITSLNIILIIIWALIVPYFAGRLLGIWAESDTAGLKIGRNLSYGFMVMCLFFVVPAIPMIFFHAPFHVLKYTWVFLMAAICTASVILSIRIPGKKTAQPMNTDDTDGEGSAEGTDSIVITENKVDLESVGRGEVKKKRIDAFTACIWIAAAAVILFETGLLTVRMHTDTDDARFIVDAMEALSKDTMLEYNPITGIHHGIPVGEQLKDLSAPYPIFIALLSSLTGLHPAIMAHTVMPLLFIPLSYVVFNMIGGVIFKEDIKKKGLFLFFLSLIHLFSFETIYSAGYTLLTIIWQGRSIVAMIMLPLTWYLLLRMGDRDSTDVRDYVLAGISALANAMLSNMGSLFALVLCMAYAFSYSAQDRKIKPLLYMGLAMVPDIAVIIISRVLYSGILYK